MISVVVYINNVPIITRAARNVGEVAGTPGLYRYRMDDGRNLVHQRKDGAAQLAILMLEGVVEP